MHIAILSSLGPVIPAKAVSEGNTGYIIGGIIALLILGYLIYTLLWPEKF